MDYIGDFRVAAVHDHKFTSRSFSTGVPTTLAGTPACSVYKDNNTTQTTTGVTLTVDFDGVTGLNNVNVDTANAFYAAGSNFDVVITTGTVGGVSVVGEVVYSFSVEARSAIMPTTAGRTLDVSATGEAGVDWANVGSPTTAVNLSGTTTNLVNTVTTYTGNTVQTGDNYARLGAPAGASHAADTAAVKVDTAAVKVQTDKFAFTTANQVDARVLTNSVLTGYRLSATGVDDVWDEATAGHTTGGTYGDKFGSHVAAVGKLVVDAGSSTTAVVFKTVDGATASAVNDFYNGRAIIFTSGAMALQAAVITDYVGASKTATVAAMTGTPATDVTGVIV